mgnify:FL=1
MKNYMSEKIQSGKQAGKNGLQHVIYGRTLIVLILVLLQIAGLVAISQLLQGRSMLVYYGFVAIGFVLAMHIINRDMDPYMKIAWIVPILAVPVLGIVCYFFIQSQTGARRTNKRLREVIQETSPYLEQDPDVMRSLQEDDPGVYNLAHYIECYGGYPAYRNTSVTYFPLGEDKFREMLIQLEKARKFIFLEYFIVHDGEMLDAILDILKRKVKQGVEVRFMYDGMCSLAHLPYDYPKELIACGIQCKVFSPIVPVLSTIQNNRDHRKILVIDGHTAFTGGVNIADEYINRKQRLGHWKDTAVMIKGDAVKNFTMMFLQMWNIRGLAPESYTRYIQPEGRISQPADGYVIPYGDSPLDHEKVGEMVYMDIINQAKKYVHICTPYLILDDEMETALRYAAKRGVDVRIILPHIPDKKYAFLLAKNHYEALISSGVKIYEYLPGFVHAKVFVSDNCKCTVGTINLDYRSLYLHFECGVFVYKNPVVYDVERDFQDTLGRCRRVTMRDCRNYPGYKKLLGHMLRIFAPLM